MFQEEFTLLTILLDKAPLLIFKFYVIIALNAPRFWLLGGTQKEGANVIRDNIPMQE